MQADGVLEYIVDHTVGVDVTASSLASRYDVSGKLGEGAFSQVWRGQRVGGGDACALKCIGLESLDDDDEALEMLANEVAALRAAALGLGAEQRRHVLGTAAARASAAAAVAAAAPVPLRRLVLTQPQP